MEIFKLLLNEENIDVNSLYKCKNTYYFTYRKETALLRAVQLKNYEMVKLLLSKPDIDVNYRATYKYNLDNGNKFLSGRDDIINVIKKTALHIAIEKGYVEICKLFLNHQNIDVNAIFYFEKNIDRKPFLIEEETCLHLAIRKKKLEIIELLLNHPKIDVNAKIRSTKIDNIINNNKGFLWEIKKMPEETHLEEKTALHLAVQKNNVKVVKLLLENKDIDVNIENEKGEKPVDLATMKEIVALF